MQHCLRCGTATQTDPAHYGPRYDLCPDCQGVTPAEVVLPLTPAPEPDLEPTMPMYPPPPLPPKKKPPKRK